MSPRRRAEAAIFGATSAGIQNQGLCAGQLSPEQQNHRARQSCAGNLRQPKSKEEEALRLRVRRAELEAEVGRIRASAGTRDVELQSQEGFNNVSVCMFLVDVTGEGRFKFAGFNPAEEQAVGLTSAEVSGRFVED